ncbi:MAG: hypothetical protein PVH25_11420 [Burkholderiales bacterium]
MSAFFTYRKTKGVSQPTIKVDLASIGGGQPERLFAGIEWGCWKNKFGISGLN